MKQKRKTTAQKRPKAPRLPSKRPRKPKPEVDAAAVQKRIEVRGDRFMDGQPPQQLLLGEEGWYWHAEVVGNDIVVQGAMATWFGGPLDSQDNGETASGVSTMDNPDILGCALPMDGYGVSSLKGSPLPKMPWKMPVVVATLQGKRIEVESIDLGPSGYTNHAIDLTTAAFQKLGGDLDTGILSVNYMIVGGAQYTKQ